MANPREKPLMVTPEVRDRLMRMILRGERPYTGAVVDGPSAVHVKNQIQEINLPAVEAIRSFYVLFTESALIGGADAQWEYRGLEGFITGTTGLDFVALPEEAEGWGSDLSLNQFALNLPEFSHIAEPAAGLPWYVWGIDLHADDIKDTGIGARPVGGGGDDDTHKTDFIALVTEVDADQSLDSNPVFWFSRMWTPDGPCTP